MTYGAIALPPMAFQSSHRMPPEKSRERKLRWWSALVLWLLILLSFTWFSSRTKRLVHEQNRLTAMEMVRTAFAEAHVGIDRGTSNATDDKQAYRDLIDYGQRLGTEFQWEAILPTSSDQGSSSIGKTEQRLLEAYTSARLPEGTADDVAVMPPGIDPFDRIVANNGQQQYQYYRPLYATAACVDCHRSAVATPQPDLDEGELLAIMRISFDHGPTAKRLAEDSAMLWMVAIVTGFLSMFLLWLGIRLVLARPGS